MPVNGGSGVRESGPGSGQGVNTNQKPSQSQRAFNATADGQKAMCADASSRATAFQMNSIIKSKGGVGWDHEMIATANPILLRAIKENLIEEFNALVGPKAS